jgi:catechol 2,3-dioxygenase-like lactoylglutathione lyase family enzyme
MPAILGLHHLRVPVSDVNRSRDWYCDVLGFSSILDREEADELVGVALLHPSGVVLGLHHDPPRAKALDGFALFALTLESRAELATWIRHLDSLDVTHSGVIEAHSGLLLQIEDPDRIVIELHTADHPSADEA